MGYDGVSNFYRTQFIGKTSADTSIVRISRTVGKDQVVDELILNFTHDVEIPFMLPGIQPAGKRVKLPHVVVMKFKNGKGAHEPVYWDQASLLAPIGLLDPTRLPVVGAEQASRLLELSKPTGD